MKRIITFAVVALIIIVVVGAAILMHGGLPQHLQAIAK